MTHPQLAPVAAPSEPPFLLQNWKRVMGSTDDAALQYVRVANNTASVTNGQVILRCRVNMPDGFYVLTRDNQFRQTKPQSPLYNMPAYPDIETYRVDFNQVRTIGRMPKLAIEDFVRWCEHARILEQHISIESGGAYMVGASGETPFQWRFNVHGDLYLRPGYLKMALMEMLRYDDAGFYKESSEEGSSLILGHNWDSCALVATLAL